MFMSFGYQNRELFHQRNLEFDERPSSPWYQVRAPVIPRRLWYACVGESGFFFFVSLEVTKGNKKWFWRVCECWQLHVFSDWVKIKRRCKNIKVKSCREISVVVVLMLILEASPKKMFFSYQLYFCQLYKKWTFFTT